MEEESSPRDPSSAPQDFHLCPKEGLRVPDKGGSVTSPALGVRLAHEVGFQFGHHKADDPDKDEKVHLQGRGEGDWRPPQNALATPSSLSARAHPPQLPSPAHSITHPNGEEDGQPDYEPVIHVGVPGPTAGRRETHRPRLRHTSPQQAPGSPIHKGVQSDTHIHTQPHKHGHWSPDNQPQDTHTLTHTHTHTHTES